MSKWTINHNLDGWPVCYNGVRLEKKEIVSLANKMDATEVLQDELIAAQRNEIARLKGVLEPCSDTFIATAERQVNNAMELLGRSVMDRDKAIRENASLRETLIDIKLSMGKSRARR